MLVKPVKGDIKTLLKACNWDQLERFTSFISVSFTSFIFHCKLLVVEVHFHCFTGVH